MLHAIIETIIGQELLPSIAFTIIIRISSIIMIAATTIKTLDIRFGRSAGVINKNKLEATSTRDLINISVKCMSAYDTTTMVPPKSCGRHEHFAKAKPTEEFTPFTNY